jgi:nucleoside 2-deoxyribosyltransferase
MKVYLVGPVTGRSERNIRDWRDTIKEMAPGLVFVDPASMPVDSRISFKLKERPLEAMRRLEHGRYVLDRNKHLLKASDVVLANFLGSVERASIGSVGELFWANALGKPIVVVREASGNVHDHAMINGIASRICGTLAEGCVALQEMATGSSDTA